MEAVKLKNIADLELLDDERFELINGQIIKRSMARIEHGLVQSDLISDLSPIKKKGSSDGGWWIVPEISVRYNEHQCPTHDLAGWRKSRVPQRPTGVMDLIPDWVCEITSPGHENKDTVDLFLLLQKQSVPYYWIIWPEKKVLIVYKLVNDKYAVIESVEYKELTGSKKLKIEPFKQIKMDFQYIFAE